MKTVTAKELRNNLESILERVNAGEEIIVKHRFKDPVIIRNYKTEPIVEDNPNALPPGLAALYKAPRKKAYTDEHKSFKELYYEDMRKKYGL